MAGYNRTRYVEQLLEKTQTLPPSFTVHLHPEHWVLNNGSKFLYQNQVASLLDDIGGRRIPVDFLDLFDASRTPFYEGCMIVELLDYRPLRNGDPPPPTAEKTRVVLHPNGESLYTDILLMNQRYGKKWTDKDALEIESQILLTVSDPLCLDPDPHLARVVNHVLRVSTPSMPASLKRKASAMEPEEDGPEKARRDRILGFMAPRDNMPHAPNYRLLDAFDADRGKPKQQTTSAAGSQYMNQPTQPTAPVIQVLDPHSATPAPSSASAQSPVDDKKIKGTKPGTPVPYPSNAAFTRMNGAHTPVPPQPTVGSFNPQHIPHTQPSNVPVMQPQVYASLEHAKMAVTPNGQVPTTTNGVPQSYLQTFQYHQPQQPQQPQQVPQQPPPQARPPSQPQQQGTPQLHPQSIQQLQAQTRYTTQSPKVGGATPLPGTSQQQPPTNPVYTAGNVTFQPSIPNAHYLQPPPVGMRTKIPPGQAAQQQQPQPQPQQQQQQGQQQGTPQMSAQQVGASGGQQQQAMYSQQQQMQQLFQQQRFAAQKANAAAQANAAAAGRATPMPHPGQQLPGGQNGPQGHTAAQMHAQRSSAATPSPARNSPLATNAQIAASNVARGSPMPAKAQLPGGVAAQGGQPQAPGTPAQAPQQLTAQQQVQMYQRYAQAQAQQAGGNGGQQNVNVPGGGIYTQLRPGQTMVMNQANVAAANASSPPNVVHHGSPPMTVPSPAGNGRPMTPAQQAQAQAVALAKSQQTPQMGHMTVGPPMRGPTPMQQAAAQQQQQSGQGGARMSPMPQHASPRQMQMQMQMQMQGRATPTASQQQQQQLAQGGGHPQPGQQGQQQHGQLAQSGQVGQVANQGAGGNITPQQQQQLQQFQQQQLAYQQQVAANAAAAGGSGGANPGAGGTVGQSLQQRQGVMVGMNGQLPTMAQLVQMQPQTPQAHAWRNQAIARLQQQAQQAQQAAANGGQAQQQGQQGTGGMQMLPMTMTPSQVANLQALRAAQAQAQAQGQGSQAQVGGVQGSQSAFTSQHIHQQMRGVINHTQAQLYQQQQAQAQAQQQQGQGGHAPTQAQIAVAQQRAMNMGGLGGMMPAMQGLGMPNMQGMMNGGGGGPVPNTTMSMGGMAMMNASAMGMGGMGNMGGMGVQAMTPAQQQGYMLAKMTPSQRQQMMAAQATQGKVGGKKPPPGAPGKR